MAGRSGRLLLVNLPPGEKKIVFRKAWETIIGRKYDEKADFSHKKNRLVHLPSGEETFLEAVEPTEEGDQPILWLGYESSEIKRLSKGKNLHYRAITFREEKEGFTSTVANKREFAGYTHGFNHSRFARQVHDLLSVVSYLKKKHGKAPVLRASAAMREQAMTAAYLSGGAVSGLKGCEERLSLCLPNRLPRSEIPSRSRQVRRSPPGSSKPSGKSSPSNKRDHPSPPFLRCGTRNRGPLGSQSSTPSRRR